MTNSSANTEVPDAPEVTPQDDRIADDKGAKKFFFETEFDFSETEKDIQSVTLRELEEATGKTKQQAYDEGFQKGVSETNEDIARIASDQLFVITGKLEELLETEKNILETFHGQVAQLCEVITAKFLPVLSEKGAKEEVQEILTKTMESVPQDEKVLVKVHPDLVEAIDKHLQKTKSDQFTGQITVQGVSDFAMADCQATWVGTGVERYMSICLQEIGGALERLSGDNTLLQTIKIIEAQTQQDGAADEEAAKAEKEVAEPAAENTTDQQD